MYVGKVLNTFALSRAELNEQEKRKKKNRKKKKQERKINVSTLGF